MVKEQVSYCQSLYVDHTTPGIPSASISVFYRGRHRRLK
jgi:hypothetical protein